MNSLAKLIDDLDLDHDLVLRRLKRSGIVPIDCWNLFEIPEEDCQPAVDLVMWVLREPVAAVAEL